MYYINHALPLHELICDIRNQLNKLFPSDAKEVGWDVVKAKPVEEQDKILYASYLEYVGDRGYSGQTDVSRWHLSKCLCIIDNYENKIDKIVGLFMEDDAILIENPLWKKCMICCPYETKQTVMTDEMIQSIRDQLVQLSKVEADKKGYTDEFKSKSLKDQNLLLYNTHLVNTSCTKYKGDVNVKKWKIISKCLCEIKNCEQYCEEFNYCDICYIGPNFD